MDHLEPHDAFSQPLEEVGFVFRRDDPELTKRYFREAAGDRRTHIHVRQAGSFSEQFALLFRDYLRTHGPRADAYGRLKRRLATDHTEDRCGYVHSKEPFIWETIQDADAWAQTTGWFPGPSDA